MESNIFKHLPNSWGHQTYMKKFRKIIKDHQVDLNNRHVHPGFIERFVNRYVRKKSLKNRINNF